MDDPVSLRLAATAMLLRDGPDGLEVFMLRRSARSAFAPDAFVFPGGTLDAYDTSADGAQRVIGLTLSTLEAEFRATIAPELPAPVDQPDTEHAAGLMRAAIREVFEEAGVLLAQTRDGRAVDAGAVFSPEVQGAREQIRSGTMKFDAFLATHDWYADATRLALFSHWITPPTEPRRYDTYFFAAPAPDDQAGSADRYETHDERWVNPAAALDSHLRGEMHLVYPTIKHLERLAAYSTVDAAMAFARSKPIVSIMPTESPDAGFVMPASLEGRW